MVEPEAAVQDKEADQVREVGPVKAPAFPLGQVLALAWWSHTRPMTVNSSSRRTSGPARLPFAFPSVLRPSTLFSHCRATPMVSCICRYLRRRRGRGLSAS